MTMCCGVAAIVLSDSAAYLTGYVASTDTPKKQHTQNKHAGTETSVQDGPALPAIFCDVIMSATSVDRLSLLYTCSIGSTQRTKEIRNV